LGKTDGRVQSRHRCAMKNLQHRIERLDRNAAVAGAKAAICVLVAAPAVMQIRNLDRYIEANRRPGQCTMVINLLRNAAEGNSR
jgi:hypothetical protein